MPMSKFIKLYDIHGKRKQVMPICTGDRTYLQVKLTMMVCPERISNVYNFRCRVHSDSAFRKHELAGRMLISCGISSCRPEPGKLSLLASAICFKLRFI